MTSLERNLEVLFAATENAPCSVEELACHKGPCCPQRSDQPVALVSNQFPI